MSPFQIVISLDVARYASVNPRGLGVYVRTGTLCRQTVKHALVRTGIAITCYGNITFSVKEKIVIVIFRNIR